MFCFAALANLNTGTMYTNLPGVFPVHSFKSMQYIFVEYIYALNDILVCAMPSKNDAAMITAFTKILATLAARGFKPTLNITVNKYSKTVEAHIKSNKTDIHLVPPHNHQVNAAEPAIATFMEYFIAGLATVHKNCPLQLWDEFLHQIELTLNFLHFSRRIPSKSANEEVHGPYDFNKMPIAPISTKDWSTTTPQSLPAGCRTEPMHSMWAPPPSTIGVCDSTCQTPINVALRTHGIYTQAIAQYQLSQPLISRSLQHATCSRHYEIPSQHQPAQTAGYLFGFPAF
jgi:hypothetical protein